VWHQAQDFAAGTVERRVAHFSESWRE